ncbi:DUF2971 domain-containing protein [Aeromonas hydrophila]|uniref:DUF2971 domain-containing protein n=1 Tax=Aeromonas hydrophila TaxID=644 RepID=UPI00214D3268|nr:DUF2971 domain-containing protein [Aeromonas hydrophila]MCR3907558.1 DUF2971 domain-containing protein [Aeromonas hydrophila]
MMDVDNDKEFFRYKYIPFGEDKLSLNIITKGTIKFTCPLYFNDPFDCQPVVSTESLHETNAFKRAVALLPKDMGLVELKIKKDKMVNDLKHRIISGEYISTFLKTVGVLSLSRQYDNALMWSHYADYHRGFVVGFRYANPEDLKENVEDMKAGNIIPYIVDYSKNKPVYTPSSNGFDMSVLLTKDDVWKYEAEERAFTWSEPPGVHPYDRAKRLHCVIAGAKISKDDLALLRNAVQQASKELGRKIKFKQARLSEKTYDLEFVDIKYKYKK